MHKKLRGTCETTLCLRVVSQDQIRVRSARGMLKKRTGTLKQRQAPGPAPGSNDIARLGFCDVE